MTQIVTHLGQNLNWTAYKNGHNQFTLTFTESGSAFDLSDYTFVVNIRRTAGYPTNKLQLTEGSGITNGGATGILTIDLTEAQASTTLPGDHFFYEIVYTFESKDYPLVQGQLTLAEGSNPASSNTSASVSVSMSGSAVSVTVTKTGDGAGLASHLADTDNPHEVTSEQLGVSVNVDDEGAVGNGSTDDTAAIRLAITAAGTGGTVHFTYGKTYLISGTLTFLSKQRIYGYGATLKRGNKVSTTLTANALEDATSLSVTDASVFAVGHTIIILDATGTYDGTGVDENSSNSNIPQTITAIDGNTITVNNGIGLPSNLSAQGYFPSGSVVVRVWNMLDISGGATSVNKGFSIYGLTFDGNKANNDLTYAWPFNKTVNALSWGSIVKDCTFHDIPNENLFPSQDCLIEGNTAYNLNGSFCHISTTLDSQPLGIGKNRIVNNNVYNSCIISEDINGHNEGVITESAGVVKTIIEGNVFNTSGGFAYGPFANGPLVLSNNICIGLKGVMYGTGNAGNGGEAIITGNVFQDCESFLIMEPTTGDIQDGLYLSRINFSNNICRNLAIYWVGVANSKISGNSFEYDANYTFDSPFSAWTKGDPLRAISLHKCVNIEVDNNFLENNGNTEFTGGAICCEARMSRTGKVFIKSDASTNTEYLYYGRNIKVRGNTINNFEFGITHWREGTDLDGLDVGTREADFSMLGMEFSGNNITVASDGHSGIVCGPGVSVLNNNIYGGSGNTRGILALGVNDGDGETYTGSARTSLNGAIVMHNKILGFTTPILVGANPANSDFGNNIYNVICQYNLFSGTLSDVTSGNSTVSDNISLIAETPRVDLIGDNPDFY